MKSHASNLGSVAAMLGDGSYTGEKLSGAVFRMTGAEVQIAKRNELHKFAVIPKRWGGGKEFCLAGQLPQALEELRKEA